MDDILERCPCTLYYPSPEAYHIFVNVYYMPVEKTYFQTVALEVVNKLGDRAPFPDSAKSLVAVSYFRWRE